MHIPNDLSEAALAYYREYVNAGGAEHAARAYAMACDQRDILQKRLFDITMGEDAEAAEVMAGQVMWAVQKSWVEASKTAEKLRDALPASAPEAKDETGYF